MVIDRKTKIDILKYWLEDPSNISKCPPNMSVDKKDVVNLLSLVYGKNNEEKTYKHYRELIDEEQRERDDEFKRKQIDVENAALKTQTATKRSQYIIAVILLATFLASGILGYLSYKTNNDLYTLNIELTDPKIYLIPVCSDIPFDDEINISILAKNIGKRGATVYGTFETIWIEYGDPSIEGVRVSEDRGTKSPQSGTFIPGDGEEIILSKRIHNISKLNTENFSLSFTATCSGLDRDCRMVSASKVLCIYMKRNETYVRFHPDYEVY